MIDFRCAICGAIEHGKPCIVVRQRPDVNGVHTDKQIMTYLEFCSPFCAARYLNGICSQSYVNSRDLGNDPRAISWREDLERSIQEIIR